MYTNSLEIAFSKEKIKIKDIPGDRSKREHFVLGTLEVEKSGLQVYKLKLKCCKDLLLEV